MIENRQDLFYVIWELVDSVRNRIVEEGQHEAQTQPPQPGITYEVQWYEPTESLTSFGVRESDPDVKAWRLMRHNREQHRWVEEWKSPEEYAGKAENAMRWLKSNPEIIGDAPLINEVSASAAQLLLHTHGSDFDDLEESYPWMWLEIDAKGCDPRECAVAIIEAVKRDDDLDMGSWVRAKRRIDLREALKAL